MVKSLAAVSSLNLKKFRQDDTLNYLYVIVAAIWGLYVALTLSTPVPTNSRFNLSDLQIFVIRLSIALPYLVIWMAAIFSFIRVRNYSLAIDGSREAEGFRLKSWAILALGISLVASSFLSAINGRTDALSDEHKYISILTNYTFVFPYLIAFWFFYQGSTKLLKTLRSRDVTYRLLAYGIVLSAFCYIWLDLIFTNESRTVSPSATTPATYYLRDSLIVLTIVIPSVATWWMGVLTLVRVKEYMVKVKGVLYRRALAHLIRGEWAVIVGSILIQSLLSLGTKRILDLGLGKILGLIYIFVLVQIFGFLYIAFGAKRLSKIEKV